jgi:hypothetical protein
VQKHLPLAFPRGCIQGGAIIAAMLPVPVQSNTTIGGLRGYDRLAASAIRTPGWLSCSGPAAPLVRCTLLGTSLHDLLCEPSYRAVVEEFPH